jgi:multidrug efflux pump subunit AcrB
VKDFEQGPPLEAPVAIRIFGENLDSLRSLSMKVEKILKRAPGTIYVNNPLASQQTDLRVRINKDKAGLLGVSPLRHLARVEFETSPNLIRHYDKARYATVTAFVKSGFLYEAVNDKVITELEQLHFPARLSLPGGG